MASSHPLRLRVAVAAAAFPSLRSAARPQCLLHSRLAWRHAPIPTPSSSATAAAVRSFQSSSKRFAGLRGQVLSAQLKDNPQKSLRAESLRQAEQTDSYPNDLGLLPGTLIRPSGANMPSWFTDFKKRSRFEWQCVKVRFTDVVSRLLYKWYWATSRPRPLLSTRRTLKKTALSLQAAMYSAVASGDLQQLTRLTADGLNRHLATQIARRPPGPRLRWDRPAILGCRIMANRAAQIPHPTQPGWAVRQVVVRIRSRQRLVELPTPLERLRIVEREHARRGGVGLPVDDPHPDPARRQPPYALAPGERVVQEKTTDELLVIQRRLRMGREDPRWMVWGLTKETTPEEWEEQMRMLTEALAAGRK